MAAVVSDTLTSGHWNSIASLYPALGSGDESWQHRSLALRAQRRQPRFRTECLLVDLRDRSSSIEYVVKYRGIPLGFFVDICRVPRLRSHQGGPAID